MAVTLFGFPFAPYVTIARVGLAVLGVDYQINPVPPHSEDPDFVKASPQGRIPAVADDDYTTDDSTAIVAYFDAKVHKGGANSIFGGDPASRARIVKFEKYLQIEGFDIANRFFRHIRFQGTDEQFKEVLADAAKVLTYLESELQENGHFVGSTYSAADAALFGRLVSYHIAGQSLDGYPKLEKFYRDGLKKPEFAKIQEEAAAAAAAAFSAKQ